MEEALRRFRVPVALHSRVGQMLCLVDGWCAARLDEEYAALTQRVIDARLPPHLTADELSALTEVAKSTLANKARQVREVAGRVVHLGTPLHALARMGWPSGNGRHRAWGRSSTNWRHGWER